jgi:hypothetical protein
MNFNKDTLSEKRSLPSQSAYRYIFLDEGGNLDFSPSGTKYFTLTTIATTRPFSLYGPLSDLRYDLIELGLDLEYFHATEDRQPVRDKVFAEIANGLPGLRIDSLIVEKSKTGPALRAVERFYPEMLGYLLRYLFKGSAIKNCDEVIVITDSLPVNNKRRAIEKSVKVVLQNMLPSSTPYRLLHHASKACLYLQVADYINWAIYRKWEGNDRRSYDLISDGIHSEYEIFQGGGDSLLQKVTAPTTPCGESPMGSCYRGGTFALCCRVAVKPALVNVNFLSETL